MKNFVAKGHVLTVVAAAAIASGDGVLEGKLFGIAQTDAEAGADVPIVTEGVFELAKAAQAISTGDLVYWSTTNANVTTTATGNTLVGVATATAAEADATVNVKLLPIVA